MTIDPTEVERIIHDIHDFFTDWVGGRCPSDDDTFRRRALDYISDDLVAIFPAGRSFGKADFEGYMTGIYGSNPDFRIKIKDVQVRHLGADMAVVTYQEWQRGAKDSDDPENGRVTTMVLGKGAGDRGLTILQVHETWLPEEVVAKGDFDF
ncbi:nuclear transport factor 2 family protein [Defluviimonas sp. WL0024]|uniref:Nuclear transport factor 2 family protein n=2 Tax=Albidovulum TaxID=205889 RepID=A0ABT3J578_9RHOB|nr:MULTISPECIES: nuclear transport factor 2 family protein [Defluviimonas]MCU9849254.1 nuclear transport factor 2 family protein [Defluviimonas sp. WL0024]MCW3782620.1 nuclear transport factor 2 family protein [Defluviimonas salinarum]